ncbi:MAG TPA: aldose epimerase family protein [Chryseolinea sp.]|nr:aldose epimerase family protein [Chryseolinea sp.]
MKVQQALHIVRILNDGQIQRVILKNKEITVELTNIGASIVAIHMPDMYGIQKNIVAGFEDLSEYYTNKDYMGCVVGRFANRIAKGRFSLNGEDYQLPINNPPNHLHGGAHGFHQKTWQIEGHAEHETDCSVSLSCYSPDKEEGYPGNVHATVQYTLSQNKLKIRYAATTDKATPINLTNHSYFNLTGFESATIVDHVLQINADYYTEKSPANTSTGTILPVAGTDLDFRNQRTIGEGINGFPVDMGYDHNFVLRAKGEMAIAAVLSEPNSGRSLTVLTNKPGLQIYSGNYFDGSNVGTQGKAYIKHGAVALETQLFPDSVNHPQFPNTIINPGQRYNYTTTFQFDVI